MIQSNERMFELPWLRRDHERIDGMLSEIRLTLQREAMPFVVHRLLEDLRVFCRLHRARLHYAMVRAGLGEEQFHDCDTFVQRLLDVQRRICISHQVDHVALWEFLQTWWTRHQEWCEKTLLEAVNMTSCGTRWEMVRGDVVSAIPVDPQTSGAFLV